MSIKKKIQDGKIVRGIFVNEFRSANIGALLDMVGYDFAIFDMEHCTFSATELSLLIPGFRSCQCRPLIRVPAVRREFFQSSLDLGIAGIIVPMVETAEEVRQAVAMMKYPPLGRRGLSFCCPHCLFENHENERDSYTKRANDDLTLIIQIESEKGLTNLESILAVPGIDIVFVGNADLSISLGKPNKLESGPIHDAVRYILQTARKHGIPGGGNFIDSAYVSDFVEDGLQFITLGSEVERLLGGLKSELAILDESLRQKKDSFSPPNEEIVTNIPCVKTSPLTL